MQNKMNTGYSLVLLILILCICVSGCIQVPLARNSQPDNSSASTDLKITPSPGITITPVVTQKQNKVSDQDFPPGMPPQVRERLMREGKIPAQSKAVNTGSSSGAQTQDTTNASHVTRMNDTYAEDFFIPSRTSIYFTNNSSPWQPETLYPIYSESDIPLNSIIKNRQVYVKKGPFSVRFTVHPQGTPLVSWAKITVMDPFLNIIQGDGYNREFSSESPKEFIVYRNGTCDIQLSGNAATLDISVCTPDGTLQSGFASSEKKKSVPANMPPEIRERLMREGKI